RSLPARGSAGRDVRRTVPLLRRANAVRLRGDSIEAGCIHFKRPVLPERYIGKYLSRLHKLHQVIAPKEGFEAQLRAARVPITFGMSALGMTSQIHAGRLYRVIEPGHVPGLQGLDNPA